MTINFYLETNKNIKSKEIAIRCFVRSRGKTLPLNPQEKIEPDLWNKEQQRADISKVKNRQKKRELEDLNEYLDLYKNNIKNIIRSVRLKDQKATFEKIALEIKKNLSNQSEEFFPLYDKYIQSKATLVEYDTLRKNKKTRRYAEDYQKKKGTILSLDSTTPAFFTDFYKYLLTDKENMNNSAMKIMSDLKSFFLWAHDNEYTNNRSYKSFKIRYDETEVIFITEDELNTLMDVKLNHRLEKIRDIFVFQCHTGRRYCETNTINRSDIQGDVWRLWVKKGIKCLNIPLVDVALDILDKYKKLDTPLPRITNQNYNLYLKEICKICGFNEEFTLVRRRGKERIENTYKKHEIIGTHTARRTFVCLSIKYKIPPEVVMSITGHSTYKMMMRYLKIMDEQKYEEMNRAWGRKT